MGVDFARRWSICASRSKPCVVLWSGDDVSYSR